VPKSFLDRYQAGECAAVWDDLVALGAGVRHELYLADAQAVARETMRRARRNVEMLIGKLERLGYSFLDSYSSAHRELDDLTKLEATVRKASLPNLGFSGTIMESLKHLNLDPKAMTAKAMEVSRERAEIRRAARNPEVIPEVTAMKERAQQTVDKLSKKPPLQDPAVFCPPGKDTAKLLAKVENVAGGPMPLSLRAWYEEVGGVSLMGSHPTLNAERPRIAPDPLVMFPLEAAIQMMGYQENDEDVLDEDVVYFDLSPDDLHKADTSGGGPYSMRLPDAAADGLLLEEGRNTTLVAYLRLSFAWGGFPGWERASDAPAKELDFLREGLLPI
jgi:hypothetical protein